MNDPTLHELTCPTCGWSTLDDPALDVRNERGGVCSRCGSDMHEVD